MGLIFQEGLSFSGFERNCVYMGGPGMHYLDLSDLSGADSDMDCRASIVADFDDDGDPDLFVNAIQRETHLLFRNDVGAASGNGFVKVKLRAASGQPFAIGATVRLQVGDRVQAQLLSCGSGFEAQNDHELIFGLGKAEQGTLSVRWPGRQEETFGVVRGGRYWLREGTGKTEPYAPQTFAFGDPPIPGMVLKVGDALTGMTVRTLSGTEELLDLRGPKPILLNFWSTTCASCIGEMPQLVELAAAGETRVICVNLEPEGRAAVAQKLWEKKGLKLPVYRLDPRDAGQYFDLSRLAIPVSLWVTHAKITRIHQGQLPEG